jgi:hypothetical protein
MLLSYLLRCSDRRWRLPRGLQHGKGIIVVPFEYQVRHVSHYTIMSVSGGAALLAQTHRGVDEITPQ